MDRIHRWALSLILYAMTCGSCGAPRLIPLTLRPDTRKLGAVTIDSAAIAQSLAIFQAALPKEASVCYTGTVAESTFTGPGGRTTRALTMHLTSVRRAQSDSTNLYHVYYSRPNAGCGGDVLAAGHSHPNADVCDQSDDDANVVFESPRLLVSFAWCANGEVQILFQDGRRSTRRWREP